MPRTPADKKLVYHGSRELFEAAVPKKHVRKNGRSEVIFDEVSFHATPHKWIAMAYTYNPENGHNMGVSLYENRKEIGILGLESLEKSLQKLYGEGGYLYAFEKGKFFHKKGLGRLEVITKARLRPVTVERIDDPVSELRRMGVSFKFVDLSQA